MPIDDSNDNTKSDFQLVSEDFAEFDTEQQEKDRLAKGGDSKPLPPMSSLVTGKPDSNRMQLRKAMRKQESYLVDTLLPCGEVHLIVGPSGGGKTTWLFQQLYEWELGNPILGYKSHPCEWVYITVDRGLQSTDRTLRRIGLDHWDIPVWPIEEVSKEISLDKLFERFPKADLYVIEGFQAFMPDVPKASNQNKADMRWMAEVRRKYLTGTNKTIIGVTHNPKAKWGDAYENARSNILGSQSLVACMSTIISFCLPKDVRESKKPIETNDREVWIRGRDFPDRMIMYGRTAQGKFIEMDSSEFALVLNMDTQVAQLKSGEEVTIKRIMEWGQKIGVNLSTTKRWLSEALENGKLERVTRGVYRKTLIV